MNKGNRERIFAALIALILMGLLFWLSSISDLVFFRETKLSPLLEWMIETFRVSWGSDGYFSYGFSLHPDNLLHKAGHIVLYGLLGAFLYVASGRSVRLAMMIATLFAFSDEWHQALVPGREGRFFDVVLDVTAAWGGVWLFNLTDQRRTRRSQK